MKVKDAIFALQQLDPELDLLVEAPDGGQPYATANVCVDSWNDGDCSQVPIALVSIIS